MQEINKRNMVQTTDHWGHKVLDQFGYGHTSIINMVSETSDLTIGKFNVVKDPKYFKIIPETAGIIKVVLAGSDDDETKIFTITAAQVNAHLGLPLPFLVYKVVKSGTTATFSVVW